MNNKIFFIDAHALIYRAYYAFINNPRINSKGLNTSAIFGFVNILNEIINKEKPSHLAVCFDPKQGKNFRHEAYPEYKANRETTPEDIKTSIPYIKQILEAYNIKTIEIENFEADDIIGTLATNFSKNDNSIYMMTPDKDYAQLISENIYMYKPTKIGNTNEIIGLKEIKEKYKIDNPKQIIDILALWGDAIDNVPGVPSIGEKTAIKLINTYGNIENIYENINKLDDKKQKLFETYKEQLFLSKYLVTINLNVPIDICIDDIKLVKPNYQDLDKLFTLLEFHSLKTRITQNNLPNNLTHEKSNISKQTNFQTQLNLFGDIIDNNIRSIETTIDNSINYEEVKYQIIDSEIKLQNLINNLILVSEFCLDTETTSLNIFEAELVGLSISYQANEAFYIPMPNNFNETQIILQKFSHIFNDLNKVIVAQNIKFDLNILYKYGINIKAKLFDTMIAHYLIEPEQKHNLDFLADKYLNYKMIHISQLIGEKGKNQKNMRDIDINTVSNYACEDADITLKLKQIFTKELEQLDYNNLFYNIEMPLISVLVDMEQTGVKIDINSLNNYSQVLKQDLLKIENNIFELAGEKFNIASPRQLGIILFEKLNIVKNPNKTKTDQYSTGEEILVKLENKHPIIHEILEYRTINKLLNTYIDVLPNLINPNTQRIHTSFNQAVTATGRLSSNNPNLQNIPIKEERGREIRKSFVASDDNYVFFSADYSQIELRIMAHLSKDQNMLDAFNKYSADIHTATAAKIFNVNTDAVTRSMRSKAKTANFGIIYGISAFGLAQGLNLAVSEAKSLIDNYFAAFPKIKDYINESVAIAKEKGYVETIFKRRRQLPNINSKNAIVRNFSERNAVNAPIQGSAADIIKIAMVNINKRLKDNNLISKMILQVHDELIFDIYKEELETVKEIIIYEMQNVTKLDVPLIVEYNYGNNWVEAH